MAEWSLTAIPAKAGIQCVAIVQAMPNRLWIPAFAGMTCEQKRFRARLDLNGAGLDRGAGQVFEAQPLHFLVERRAIDLQYFGGGLPVPMISLQCGFDDPPLGLFQRLT